MMIKSIFALLLCLLPLAASAECGFVTSDDGVKIVVGKGSNHCFQSAEFREAFRDNLVAAVQTMEAEFARTEKIRKAYDDRNARASKLWTLAEREHASNPRAGRYFGQK
jgi:hypothetical protein